MKTAERNYPLLKNAPAHDSPEFIDYLRENNKVVWENQYWLIIENCKYHKPEAPWLTAFYKMTWAGGVGAFGYALRDLHLLPTEYDDWEWRKKAKKKQTVERFHIHLIKK